MLFPWDHNSGKIKNCKWGYKRQEKKSCYYWLSYKIYSTMNFSTTETQILDLSILNLHWVQFLLNTMYEQMDSHYLEGTCGVLKYVLSVSCFSYYISIQEPSVHIVASQIICSLREAVHQRAELWRWSEIWNTSSMEAGWKSWGSSAWRREAARNTWQWPSST